MIDHGWVTCSGVGPEGTTCERERWHGGEHWNARWRWESDPRHMACNIWSLDDSLRCQKAIGHEGDHVAVAESNSILHPESGWWNWNDLPPATWEPWWVGDSVKNASAP